MPISISRSDRMIIWLGIAYLVLSWIGIIAAFHFGLGWP